MQFEYFYIFFIIFGILFLGLLVFSLLLIFNPKFRAKIMSNHVKATKYMVEESKDDFKTISDDMAEARKHGVEEIARAIKKGLTENENKNFTENENKMFCKYCGAEIDVDSKFCKKCGKEL